MTARERICGLLGLAQRARGIVSGAFAVEQALAAKKGKFLIVAEDAEEETKRKFGELAEQRKLPILFILSKDELGNCLGKGYRSVALLMEEGFSRRLGEYLTGGKNP